jgi:hypothetical protein
MAINNVLKIPGSAKCTTETNCPACLAGCHCHLWNWTFLVLGNFHQSTLSPWRYNLTHSLQSNVDALHVQIFIKRFKYLH